MTVQEFEIWDSLEEKQRCGTYNTVLFHVQGPVRIITTALNKVGARILFLHYKYVRKNTNNIIWRIITYVPNITLSNIRFPSDFNQVQ